MISDFVDLEQLSHAAAGFFVERGTEAVQQRGRFSVALAGGSTPQRTYELLSESPYRERVPWERTHVFWGDERCVSPDDPQCNARMARRALLEHVPIPAGQIHPIDGTAAPADAAARYERELRRYFDHPEKTDPQPEPGRFDLILLGLGADGHTASLFPGTAALDERVRWAVAVEPPSASVARVTLTIPLLNRAAAVMFLVAGAAKGAALQKVLNESIGTPHLPASFIRPENGEVRWLVDAAAASLLRPDKPDTEPHLAQRPSDPQPRL